MVGGSAESPDERRSLLVRAIVAHRRGDDDDWDDWSDAGGGVDHPSDVPAGTAPGALVLEAAGQTVTYHDQSIRLEVEATERERLEDLYADYHVFKVAQPATRKAPDGVVVLSAVTDAKHAADFLEALFREVYELDERYSIVISGTDG